MATPASWRPAPRSPPPADRGAARWRCRRAGGRRHGHHHQRIEARPGGDAGELGAGAAVITTSGSRRGQVAMPASWRPAPRSPPPADRGAAGWRCRRAGGRRYGHHHQRIEARPGGDAASWRPAPRSPPPADRGAARWRCRRAGGRRHGHHQRIEARPGGDAGELAAGATVTTTSGSRRGQVAMPASWRPAPRSPPLADRGAARWRCRRAGGRRHGHHHQRIEARPGGDAGELAAGATVTTTSGSRRGQVAMPASWRPAPRSPPPADRGAARWRCRRAGGRRHGHHHQRIEARPGGDAGELGAGAAVITTSGSRRGQVAMPASWRPAPRSPPPADRGAAGWRCRRAGGRRYGHHHQRIEARPGGDAASWRPAPRSPPPADRGAARWRCRRAGGRRHGHHQRIEARPGGDAGELAAGATVTTTSGSRRGQVAMPASWRPAPRSPPPADRGAARWRCRRAGGRRYGHHHQRIEARPGGDAGELAAGATVTTTSDQAASARRSARSPPPADRGAAGWRRRRAGGRRHGHHHQRIEARPGGDAGELAAGATVTTTSGSRRGQVAMRRAGGRRHGHPTTIERPALTTSGSRRGQVAMPASWRPAPRSPPPADRGAARWRCRRAGGRQ